MFLRPCPTSHNPRSGDDPPNETRFIVEEGAAGKTGVDAIIVFDGVTNAIVSGISSLSL